MMRGQAPQIFFLEPPLYNTSDGRSVGVHAVASFGITSGLCFIRSYSMHVIRGCVWEIYMMCLHVSQQPTCQVDLAITYTLLYVYAQGRRSEKNSGELRGSEA